MIALFSARYRCGANYVTLANIPPWTETAAQPPRASPAAAAPARKESDDSRKSAIEFEADKDEAKAKAKAKEGGMQPVRA